MSEGKMKETGGSMELAEERVIDKVRATSKRMTQVIRTLVEQKQMQEEIRQDYAEAEAMRSLSVEQRLARLERWAGIVK